MKKILAISIVAMLVLGVGLVAASVSDKETTIHASAMRALIRPTITGISQSRDIASAYNQENIPKVPTAVPVSGISATEKVEIDTQLDSPVSVEKSVCNNGVIPLDEAATKQMAVPDKIQSLGPQVEEVGPLATYEISGTLDPNQCDCYGPWYFSPGETVTISISWTPTSSTVDVGILSASSGIYHYVPCTGGGCSHTFVVNVGGYYYPCICNEGPDTIHYNGYLTI